MDLSLLGVILTIIFGLVAIILAVPPLLKKRTATHWTQPDWSVQKMKIGNTLAPVLTARWEVRGNSTAVQGVVCDVRGPSGIWRPLSLPKGKVSVPSSGMYTHIHLTTEKPFNTQISSPANGGQPVQSIVEFAKKGRYTLRIRWHENENPKRQHTKSFSYVVN
jgi:hypothetical protein